MAELKLEDAAIVELIKYGTVTKEIKLSDKVIVYIKNLTQDDKEKYSKLVRLEKPSEDKSIDASLFAIVEASKVPLLTYAITRINDIDFSSDSSKSRLKDILMQLPSIFIDKLYAEYMNNENKLATLFNDEEVKKN